MHEDARVQELIGRIPTVMRADVWMTIRKVADALDYYTNAPWCVVFAVERLERDGVLERDTATRQGRPWRWRPASFLGDFS